MSMYKHNKIVFYFKIFLYNKNGTTNIRSGH